MLVLIYFELNSINFDIIYCGLSWNTHKILKQICLKLAWFNIFHCLTQKVVFVFDFRLMTMMTDGQDIENNFVKIFWSNKNELKI